eukprot:6207858-Pleurochrysis_carterae.AAC.1
MRPPRVRRVRPHNEVQEAQRKVERTASGPHDSKKIAGVRPSRGSVKNSGGAPLTSRETTSATACVHGCRDQCTSSRGSGGASESHATTDETGAVKQIIEKSAQDL